MGGRYKAHSPKPTTLESHPTGHQGPAQAGGHGAGGGGAPTQHSHQRKRASSVGSPAHLHATAHVPARQHKVGGWGLLRGLTQEGHIVGRPAGHKLQRATKGCEAREQTLAVQHYMPAASMASRPVYAGRLLAQGRLKASGARTKSGCSSWLCESRCPRSCRPAATG
jgi:hypothetical protein